MGRSTGRQVLVPRFDKSALNGRGDQVDVGSLEVGDLEDQQLISTMWGPLVMLVSS